MTPQRYPLADHELLLRAVKDRVYENGRLAEALERVLDPGCDARAHLAVMHEPYLSLMLSGRKTVESRFARRQVAPFGQVMGGDLLLLKPLAGDVCAAALVGHVQSYILDPDTWRLLRERYAAALCAGGDAFWEERASARYATLMSVSHVVSVEPLPVDKRDRRGWVVLGNEGEGPANPLQLAWPDLVPHASKPRRWRELASGPEDVDDNGQLALEM